jgi:hypothetical protein
MRTITYNGVTVEYKSSHRALYDYELLAGKDKIITYADSLKLMYCILRTQLRKHGVTFDLDMEGFVDWLDANSDALKGIVLKDPAEDSEESGDKKK